MPVAIVIFTFAFTSFAQAVPAGAQNSASYSLREMIQSPAVNSGGQKKEDFIKPSRPTEAEPAEIQKAGVLQLEFGLDAGFDAGLRFGVGAEAPKVSLVTGFTVGVVDLYGK